MALPSGSGQPTLRVDFPKTSSDSRAPLWVQTTRESLQEGEEQRVFSTRAQGQKRYFVASEVQEALRQSFAHRAASEGAAPERLTAEEAEAQGQRSSLAFSRLNPGM